MTTSPNIAPSEPAITLGLHFTRPVCGAFCGLQLMFWLRGFHRLVAVLIGLLAALRSYSLRRIYVFGYWFPMKAWSNNNEPQPGVAGLNGVRVPKAAPVYPAKLFL